MSSTERAPEPTMEEILASIRRIITDDEAGPGRAQKAAPQAQQEDESLEGEADNQIIDDIARVLSGGASGVSQPPADEEEEILDLAGELGGLELVEDDFVEEVVEVTEVIEVLELEELELEEAETLAEPMFEPMVETMAEASAPVPPAPPMPEPVQEMAPPPLPQMAAPEPQPQAYAPEPPQAAAPKPSAGLEAASALERAIAALRAGQVPTSTSPQAEPFRFQTAPQPEAMTAPEPEQMAASEPEPIPMAVPMEAPEPQDETHPDIEPSFEARPEPTFELMTEPEQRQELVLTEVELTIVETGEPEPSEAAEPEDENAPFWSAEAQGELEDQLAEPSLEAEPSFEPDYAFETEPEPVAVQVNGGGAHHGEDPSRTLEDSIKDMLRPMLRQWLDENMPRIVRDELDPNALRRHQD